MVPTGRTFLIADGDEEVRAVEREALNHIDGVEIVGEAATGPDAVVMAEALQPDVVLIGARMPFLNGVEAIPAIRGRAPDSRIVVVTPPGVGVLERMARKLGARVTSSHSPRGLAEELEAALEDRRPE